MRAGKLKERIDLLAAKPTAGDAWGPGQTWTPYARSLPAQVAPATASETDARNQVQSQAAFTITIRFRRDVTSEHRIAWHGRTLQIVSVTDTDNAHRELAIEAVEYPAKVGS